MQKFLGVLALTGLACYLIACAALFVFQRSLIYYPPPAAMLPGSTSPPGN